jgi:hypothetical protein
MKKKLAVLALAGFMFASAGLTFSAAMAVNDQVLCNRNHVLCRDYTLNIDAPWYKVMVLLTVCDVAFGKCMLGL